MNEYTKHLESLIIEIARAAQENKKDYFIGGGFAIDIPLGKLSRDHHDIDFHPMLSDADWWVAWFNNKGYKIENRNDPKFPETWNVFDSEGEAIVDMWPFKHVDKDLLINFNGEYVDGGRHYEEIRTVKYKDVDIKIENPQRVLEQKTRHVKQGQEYRPQDIHDFNLMGVKVE